MPRRSIRRFPLGLLLVGCWVYCSLGFSYMLEENLLINGDFAQGLQGWRLTGNGTVKLVSKAEQANSKILQTTAWAWVQQEVLLERITSGGYYSLSAAAKASSSLCILGFAARGSGPSLERRLTFSGSWETKTALFTLPGQSGWAAVFMEGTGKACQFSQVRLVALLQQTPININPANPFPLEQALSRTERAPEVIQANQKLRQAQADLRLAQAQAGLQVNLAGGANIALTNPTPTTTNLSLNLSLPLGASSAPILAVAQAELAVGAAQASLRQISSELARKVVQAYGQVLLAQSVQVQAGLLLDLAQKQAAVVEAQQRLGAATATQVLNARLAASTAQQNFSRAEGDLRDKQTSLASLLGLVGLPDRAILPSNLPTLPTSQQLLAKIEQSPLVIQAKVALEQANLALGKANAGSGFSLSLGFISDQLEANLGLSIPDYNAQASLIFRPTIAAPGQGNTLLLGASIPLWDGGSAEAARQSALLGLEFAQNSLDQTRRDTGRLLEGFLAQALLDQQNLAVQQEALLVAEKNLAEVQQRLSLGAVTALDELAARAGLEAAQGALVAAQMRVLEDLYQLYAVLGVGSV